MSTFILFWTITLAAFSTSSAQLTYCTVGYRTCNPAGTAETAADVPITCVSGSKTTCQGLNAQCTFSLKKYGYICCYELTPQTAPTPGPGSTFATPGPGSTVTPRNFKPICPNGALGFGGSQTQVCNMTNLANAGCPKDYSCVRAGNVYDFSNTPTITTDDTGAATTPNVCCKTSTLASVSAIWTESGLSPSIVPTPPTNGILSVLLPGPAVTVSLGDDRSSLTGQLSMAPTVVTLFSPTVNRTMYHVLFFNSYTNKDALFVGNILADGTNVLTIPAAIAPVSPFNATAGACVTLNTAVTPNVYAWSQAWVAPTTYTIGHRWVMLIFNTPSALIFPLPNTISASFIDLNAGLYGDFEPGRVVNNAGLFTTVTAFLNGKGKLLGNPVYGTYFTVKT